MKDFYLINRADVLARIEDIKNTMQEENLSALEFSLLITSSLQDLPDSEWAFILNSAERDGDVHKSCMLFAAFCLKRDIEFGSKLYMEYEGILWKVLLSKKFTTSHDYLDFRWQLRRAITGIDD